MYDTEAVRELEHAAWAVLGQAYGQSLSLTPEMQRLKQALYQLAGCDELLKKESSCPQS